MGGGTDPFTVSSLQSYTEAALIKGHLSPHNVWQQRWRRWRRLESAGYMVGAWVEGRGRQTEFMALVNNEVQERRVWMRPTCQRLCSHKMKSQQLRHPSSPQPSAPLISTFSRGAASTMPPHSPPPALNHRWDNGGGGCHHCPAPPPRPPNRHFCYWNSLVS